MKLPIDIRYSLADYEIGRSSQPDQISHMRTPPYVLLYMSQRMCELDVHLGL